MKVKINNTRYKIVEVDKIILDGAKKESVFFGSCNYQDETIELLSTLSPQKKKDTLVHELTHAFVFENGHTEDTYSLEKLCDLFGAYAENIMAIVRKYFKED